MAFNFSNKLRLFSEGEVDSSVDDIYYNEYKPKAPISEGSVVNFVIPGTSQDYVDLNQSKVYDKVLPINLTLHSLWRQVEVQLNQTNVDQSVGVNNPYKCYFQTLLNYSGDSKESVLQSEMYYQDKSNMDSTEVNPVTNQGAYQRGKMTEASRSCEMIGPLRFTDLATQERLIPNGVEVKFNFYPSTDAFRLMDGVKDVDHKIIVEDMSLYISHVNLKPSVILGLEAHLAKTAAVYPYMRTAFKTYNLPAGSFDITVDDLFAGEVPSKLIVGLVESAAYTGSLDKNPYNFRDFHLSFIEFCVDGNKCGSFQPNFSAGRVVEPFHALAYNRSISRTGNHITLADFLNGFSLFVFNENLNLNKRAFPEKKYGQTRLTLRFDEALQAPVTLILQGEFYDRFIIDKNRAVFK